MGRVGGSHASPETLPATCPPHPSRATVSAHPPAESSSCTRSLRSAHAFRSCRASASISKALSLGPGEPDWTTVRKTPLHPGQPTHQGGGLGRGPGQPARFRAKSTSPHSCRSNKDTAVCIFWRKWLLAVLVAPVESPVCAELSWAHRLGYAPGHPGNQRGMWLIHPPGGAEEVGNSQRGPQAGCLSLLSGSRDLWRALTRSRRH